MLNKCCQNFCSLIFPYCCTFERSVSDPGVLWNEPELLLSIHGHLFQSNSLYITPGCIISFK